MSVFPTVTLSLTLSRPCYRLSVSQKMPLRRPQLLNLNKLPLRCPLLHLNFQQLLLLPRLHLHKLPLHRPQLPLYFQLSPIRLLQLLPLRRPQVSLRRPRKVY
jgi:hypothetical protein